MAERKVGKVHGSRESADEFLLIVTRAFSFAIFFSNNFRTRRCEGRDAVIKIKFYHFTFLNEYAKRRSKHIC